jgi:hypothetical protein
LKRLAAIRALRLNYKWRGVYVWLKGRQKCRRCSGSGRVSLFGVTSGLMTAVVCPSCNGGQVRGYQRILSEPGKVIREQTAIAEGVMG